MTVYIHYPQERVYFGDTFTEALEQEATRLGANRLFFLASRSLEQNTNLLSLAARALGMRFAGQVTGMPPHSPRDAVLEMVRAARAANADAIVTFGGGSLTDAGKMVRLCLQHANF